MCYKYSEWERPRDDDIVTGDMLTCRECGCRMGAARRYTGHGDTEPVCRVWEDDDPGRLPQPTPGVPVEYRCATCGTVIMWDESGAVVSYVPCRPPLEIDGRPIRRL